MGGHAVLSPSAAGRWLACHPSARLEQTFTDTGSDAAREGTLAHALGELMLRYKLGLILTKVYEAELKVIEQHEFYSLEMYDHCEAFMLFVMEKFHEAQVKTPDALIFLEQRVDMTDYVPEGFGTADVVIIADGTMINIDLKYGKGVLVNAVENKQMMLYSLGLLKEYDFLYSIKLVEMIIYQPRIENFSGWLTEADVLKAWGEMVLIPAAKEAWQGVGEFVPGSHCKFCKVKTSCKANAEHQLVLAVYAFRDAALLTPEEISDIMDRAKGFTDWLNSVEEHALREAILNGARWPGYKLVLGRSNRQYTDQEAIKTLLLEKGLTKEEIVTEKLKGITEMTKVLGTTDFNKLLNDYIMKPPGKPTLVPEADMRPEYHSADAAAEAFNDGETLQSII